MICRMILIAFQYLPRKRERCSRGHVFAFHGWCHMFGLIILDFLEFLFAGVFGGYPWNGIFIYLFSWSSMDSSRQTAYGKAGLVTGVLAILVF